jgi:hypothetical protein
VNGLSFLTVFHLCIIFSGWDVDCSSVGWDSAVSHSQINWNKFIADERIRGNDFFPLRSETVGRGNFDEIDSLLRGLTEKGCNLGVSLENKLRKIILPKILRKCCRLEKKDDLEGR